MVEGSQFISGIWRTAYLDKLIEDGFGLDYHKCDGSFGCKQKHKRYGFEGQDNIKI